jgi:hypothetical protein
MKRIITRFAVVIFVLTVIVLAHRAATARAGSLAAAPAATPAPAPSPTPVPVKSNFSPEEKAAETLYEGALMDASMLVETFGPASGNLSLSGSFSGSSWQSTLSGDYAGQPVSITANGTIDPATGKGTFTSTGSYGSGTWDGSGDWSYAVVDANTLDLTWNSQAIIDWLKKLFKPDKHFTQPKRWARSILPDGSTHVVDSGTYKTTYFGIPFGRSKPQISDWIYPPGGGGIATVAVQLTEDGIALASTVDVKGGTVSGSLSFDPNVVVDPLPSTDVTKTAAEQDAN